MLVTRFDDALRNLERSLSCFICGNTLSNTRIVAECGHYFCSKCVIDEVGEKGKCPQCHMPAIRKNLQHYYTLDTLSVCVQKLRFVKREHDMLLASSSFSDEKEEELSESMPKRRRITPTAKDVDGCSSYEESYDIRSMNKNKSSDIAVCDEIKGSQEEFSSLPKPDQSSNISCKTASKSKELLLTNGNVMKLMYTGLMTSDEDDVNKSLVNIGATSMKIEVYKDSDWIDEKVTHVITSMNDEHLCRRTKKYLDAIIKGKWIVGHQWLADSISAGRWLDERNYEVAGDLTTGVSLAASKGRLMRASKTGLFQGLRIYFQGDFQRSPSRNDLMLLARSAGARILQRRPTDNTNEAQITNTDTRRIDVGRSLIVVEEIPVKRKKSQDWLSRYQVVPTGWLLEAISRLSLQVPMP